jgi:hypothetical protein
MAFVLLGLVPMVAITILMVRYAVNVPYWDDWDIYVAPWLRGTEVQSCWPLFNGHRLILPCLIGHALARISSMNALLWVFAKIPFFIAIYFLIYRIYRHKAATDRFYLLAIPFSLLVFSMAYWPMWIDPRPIFSQMAQLTFLVVIWSITTKAKGWKPFAIAALMAYISSLSFFSGNISWIVGGIALWLRGYRERRYLLLWIAMALTILIPYTYDYLQPQVLDHSAPINNIFEPAVFTLAFLGSPLAPGLNPRPLQIGVSAAIGAIGVAAGVGFSLRLLRQSRAGLERAQPWLLIMLWVCVNAFFIALAREGISGVGGALSPRYTSFGAIFWIGVVVLMVINGTQRDLSGAPDRGKRVSMAATGLLSLLIVTTFAYRSLSYFQEDRLDELSIRLLTGRECLLRYDVADERCLEFIYPNVDRLKLLMDQVALEQVSFLEGPGTLLEYKKLLFLDPIKLDNVPHPIDEQIAFERAILVSDFLEGTLEQFRSIGDGFFQLIYQHPPSSLTWRLDLRNNTRVLLRSGVLVVTPQKLEADPSDGALYEVSVSDGGQVNVVFQRLVLPSTFEEGFEAIEIDLSEFAGKTVDLTLSTWAGADPGATLNYDWAFWHYPELILDRLGE